VGTSNSNFVLEAVAKLVSDMLSFSFETRRIVVGFVWISSDDLLQNGFCLGGDKLNRIVDVKNRLFGVDNTEDNHSRDEKRISVFVDDFQFGDLS